MNITAIQSSLRFQSAKPLLPEDGEEQEYIGSPQDDIEQTISGAEAKLLEFIQDPSSNLPPFSAKLPVPGAKLLAFYRHLYSPDLETGNRLQSLL